MLLDVSNLTYKEINQKLRETDTPCRLTGCCGQRFIAAGMSGGRICIDGTPGNALGAYLNGTSITVNGNAQDAVGDTMNEGEILIHGNVGDAVGYAMRGGSIYIKGNAGYRAGIHMKAYKEKVPVMVIGGTCGSFLGEYQAGGLIIVLGLSAADPKQPTGSSPCTGQRLVSNFPCTGMHGGKVFLRGDCSSIAFPPQVTVQPASAADLQQIKPYLIRYCELFDSRLDALLAEPFSVVTPNSSNPYKQLYITN